MKLVYGCDPEVFAAYPKEGKLFCLPPVVLREDFGVEAHIEHDPNHPVFLKRNGWVMHEDGSAFEMAVMPSTDPMELWYRVNEAMSSFSSEVLAQFSDKTGLCDNNLKAIPTVHWEVERWAERGEDFHYCTRFGCDPDLDAFHTAVQCRTEDARDHPFRYGGGHIHISGIKGVEAAPELLVYSLAFTAGLAAVIWSDKHEEDRLRTYRYGKPGKYRVQKYGKLFNGIENTNIGIEYRPLSNAWVSNRELYEHIIQYINLGVEQLYLGGALSNVYHLSPDVERAIIQHDVALATDLLAHIEKEI